MRVLREAKDLTHNVECDANIQTPLRLSYVAERGR